VKFLLFILGTFGVFENIMMKTIPVSGLKKQEVTGGWINLHDEELNRIYSSPHVIRVVA
jgi:hypothetical protein